MVYYVVRNMWNNTLLSQTIIVSVKSIDSFKFFTIIMKKDIFYYLIIHVKKCSIRMFLAVKIT